MSREENEAEQRETFAARMRALFARVFITFSSLAKHTPATQASNYLHHFK